MANEWSQELLNEINSAGQAFEEAALSGNPRIPDSVRQQVAENVFYRYYQQQQAEREANRGRTSHSYLRDSVYNNVVNPVEYSSEELTAARNRVAELQDQVNRLTAANNSRYVSEAYKAENKAELENKQSALALAQQQQERMERDTARARQATQRRVVDEAAERGVSYKDQYDAYSQTLDRLNKDKEALLKDRSRIKNGAGYYGAAATYEEDKARQEADEKENSDRLEKLTREIERLEGQRAYAENFLTKDAGAKQIIKQGEELARIAHANKQQNEINALEENDSDAGFRAAVAFREAERPGLSPDDRWTQEQKDLYHYYWGAYGQDAAEGFAERVNRYLNSEEAAAGNGALPGTEIVQQWAERGGKWATAGKALVALAGKLGVNNLVYNAASYIDRMLNVAATGKDAGRSFALPNEIVDAASRGVTNRLNETQIVGGKGLGDLYQLGTSMAQSLVYGNGLGKIGTLGAFFFQAANSSYDEAMQRGASAQYAAAYSTLCGISEGAWETFSFDKLIKGDWTNHFFRTLVSQGFIEGSEEVNTSLFNKYAETLAARLTNEQSMVEREISSLVANGMSRKDAEHQIWTQFAKDVAWDFAGGFISGFGSSAIQSGVQQTQNKLWKMRKDSVLGTKGGAHIAGEDGKATGKTGVSNASDAQLEKLLVQAEKRGDLQTALFLTNELINREEAGQRQRPTGDPNSTSMLAERILDGMRRKAGITDEQEPEIPAEQAQQRTPLEIALDEQEAEMRQQQTAQNAAGQQEASAGQITQPNQQNAAQTVKPGDSEQQKRGRSDEEKASAFQRALDGERSRLLAESQERQDYLKRKRAEHSALFDGLKKGDEIYIDGSDIPAMKVIDADGNGNLSIEIYGADGEFVNLERVLADSLTGDNIYNLIEVAENVSVGNPGQVENKLFNVAQNPNGVSTRSTESGTVRTLNLLENIPYKGDVSNLTLEERAANLAYINRQGDFLDELEKTGSYSKEEIYRAAREIQDAIGRTVGHDLLKYQVDFLWDEAERINNGGKTNAGEQAVQQPEAAAAGESDAERPVREAGEQAARGVLGEQRQDTEGESVEPETQSGTERRAPSFVTEQEVREWSDTNQAEDISPEAKTKYKAILKDANDGTKVVTKPKTGSHLHFVQNFFKRLGIIDDVMLASNDSGSVFKDGSKGKENSGKIIMDANVYGEDLIPASAHEASHKKLFDHYGGVTAKDILNGSYNQRMGAFTRIFMNAFGPMNGLKMMTDVQNIIREDYGYGKQYNRERGGRVAAVNREAAKSGRTLGTDANALVKEMEQARALEEFINEIVAWDGVFIDAVEKRLNLTDEQIGDLRNKIFDEFKSSGVMTDADVQAINDFITEAQELEENGDFTDEELEGWPGFGLSDDLFDELDISESSNFGSNEERRRELAATLRTLISGDTEAIGRLSTDYLNYAINYTLKKADPDLDFKEKRRTYNAIANVLSGMNIDTFGYDRNVARNESNDKNNAGFDGMMSKAPNKLFYAVSSRTQADDYEGGRRGMDTIGNLQPGQYRPTGNATDMQTVLRNAINELDRRGLNIWGKENNNRFEYDEETDDTGKQYERSDTDSDYSSQYNSATYGDSKAEDDYSDEYNEGSESRESKLRAKDQRAAEKREATSALRRLREGDNWLEGAVKVSPEAKEWGRGAKKTAGQKTQGWYDINRRSSLAEREFARQRVMNARAAEDLSFEIQTMEDQADDIREEVELARRNSPVAKESLKMIDGLLEDLNSDIDDLHAIDDMFSDAVREDPNSDMTKQLAAEGTRLASEIESFRRDIDTLGRLANESIANNNSEELRDAEKRLRKQEQKIKAKREHLKKLLDESHGGDKSGALVASRAETAFDRMPDDVIKQIIRNGYVSMDMLQNYYGNADAAYQTMYEFQERAGETGKTRVPSVHKLTGLEKTALHGILADRKKAGKITSGYGGVEMSEDLPERSPSAPASMSKAEYTEAMQQEYGPYISDEQRKKSKSKSANDKRIPATVQPITNEAISERNRRAYQSSKFNGGMVLEPTGPTPANMDRLNRMFADRLGIKNKGNTAIAYGKRADAGTWEDEFVSESSDFGSNKGQEKKPLIVDAAYTNYAAAAQSVADLHKKILSDIMAENPNAEPDFIDKQIEDSFLGNSVRALDTAVSQIANSKDPLGAVFNLRQQIYSAKNKGEGTYAALASDAVIGMCDEIGRLIENKTMPYDEKARAYAVATTQLVSALSTRAERLYEAAHRVQRIQDKLATVTKKDRGSLRQLGTGYLIKQMNPTTLFKMLDDFDVSGKGAGYEIARALENGTVKSAELIARAARQFDEAKKTEGFQEFAEGKTIAKYKFKGEYTISELQAIEFILLARRINGMKVYDVDTHGGVIEKTRLQTLKGFALRDADGNHIFVDSMYEDSKGKKKRFDWYKEAESMYRNLSPAAKAYMKAANKVLDGLGKEIRQTKINATGVGFSGMEGTGYYPMSYMSQKEHLPDYNANPDYEGLSQDKHLQSVRLTHGGYAVVQNAAKTVDRYIEWASNYAAYGDIADMLLTMNTSGNGRGIVNATGDAYGAQYAKAIEKYIGDINNFTDTQKNDVVNSALRGLRQKMAAGALGLSLSVPIKQVASYWDAAGILSMDSLRRAYRFKLVNEKGLGADNMFLQSRKVGNIDPTVSEMLGSGLLDSLKKRSGIIKRFAEATNTMDYRTVDNLFTATVLDVEASLPGIDKDSDLFKRAVEAKFNQVVLNTQPIFNKNARSEYQRSSNEIERALGMFRTQQTQNLNRIITSVMEARSTKGTSLEAATKRQLRQTLAGQIAGQLEFAALTAIANTVMHGWKRWRDDDDEITMESIIKRFGLDFTESIAGTAWFGDEAAKAIVDRVFGTNESFGVSVGVLSTLADTGKYFFDVVDDLRSDDPLALFDSLRKFVGSAATVAGKPVNNVYRLANAAVMWGADILKWASKGKYGNRANYDDSMKMLDAWIKGGLKEEGAKTQAAKAFRKDQPENLLYNLGILSSLTKEGSADKGASWLNTRIQGKTEAEREAYKEDELARLGRNLNAGERIANYLANSALSAAQKDEAISKFATTSGYNVLYESLRAAGMTPKAAVEELGKTDNKTGLSTDIRSDDSLADLYAGKDNPGDTNDVPALDKKNTDEYVNFVSAMKVFRDTGNYSQLDKLVDQYSKLDANTRVVIDAKDSAMKRYREYRSMGLSTKDYYNVKDAIKQAQVDLDLAANTGTAVKLVGLSKANLTKAQIQKLVNSEALGISKTGKSLISVLSKYGYSIGDIGMFMYNTDWTNDDANGTLSQQEVVLALAKEKRLTDAQRSAIYEELKPLLRNEYKINHWYDKSYEYELNYLKSKGATSGRAS